MSRIHLDVLVFGGGIAGLWTLDRLRSRGYGAALLESDALGAGQTVQSQGIIHGGGKYALRGLSDLASVRAIRDMPDRWLRHHTAQEAPDLSAARVLSPSCLLWSPASWKDGAVLGLISTTGVLSTRPRRLARTAWPPILQEGVGRVETMAEPVFATRSVLRALAAPHAPMVWPYRPGEGCADVGFERQGNALVAVHVRGLDGEDLELRPRAVVLAAGGGNARLLSRAGVETTWMQRRPLHMVMLRGRLPELFGHCVAGGKTRLTVTSARDREATVWQLGGELAETLAQESDPAAAAPEAAEDELRRCLPGLEREGLSLASYSAVRAEGRHPQGKRPSGVHVEPFAPNAWVVWPTKLALAPLAAAGVVGRVEEALGPARHGDTAREAPPVEFAAYPWEEAAWTPVR